MIPKNAPTFAGWEVLEKLGEGGMCSVWRVRPTDAEGQERAIKMLHDTSDASVKRFADEARLLQRIDHPNVLKIHELHDEVRPPWIVMELLAGRDLEETRVEQGAMDPERAARLIADVANGLALVHELGVRHRDIKPANIMLGHDGVPRLIDFGIARETAQAHVTQQGFVVGTASYLPPEIFVEDDSHAIQDSELADVYALGQTLCEILSGEPVHGRGTDGTAASLLVHIMKDKLDRPHLDPRDWRPQVPDDLAEIVCLATKQEPEDRLPTARELEDRLRAWIRNRHRATEAPLTAVDPTALPPPPGTVERKLDKSATSTAAPVARRAAGTAAAASAAGIGLLAASLGVITLLGAILLVLFAPTAPSASPKVQEEVARVIWNAQPRLGTCARAHTRGEVVLSFVIHEGKARRVEASGGLDAGVSTCLRERVAELDFPRDERVAVRLPLTFQ